MARRLVEAGVPFITVFWKGDENLAKKCRSAGSWDTHGNNFNCLRENLLPQFDRCFSAFLEDLSSRGLLDETLVMVTSEMGRMPKVGDRRSGGVVGAGRDHWTACMSVLMAGAGIRGGQVVGETDARAELPKDRPIRPEDEPMIKAFHYTLSERSVYYRYFNAFNLDQRIAHDRLARICFIDYDREMALVVERNGDDGEPEIIAVGRLSRLHGVKAAEFSMTISDAWQRHGLGKELLQRLVEIGRQEGLARISADILPDNAGMQAVARKVGFTVKTNADGDCCAEIIL